MKAYIVGGNKELINFLPDLELVKKPTEAKIVIFDDGPIVSPSLYHEKKIPDLELKCDINRDRSDKAVYTKLRPDQIAVGIGRGACFLSVMNGAKLIQQVYRHSSESSYMVESKYGDKTFIFTAISNWQQSINLKDCTDFDFVARSKECYDHRADNETKRFMQHNGDPEIVKFHKPNCPISICIQFHPEWMPDSPLSKYVKAIIYDCAH